MSEPEDEEQQSEHWRSIREWRRHIGSVREEMVQERGRVGAVIDRIGRLLARPVFFTILVAVHLLWIVLNLGAIPWIDPWDPYPFVFLATVASVEAPFAALLILMRQERDRRVEELRAEVSLQVSLQVERKNTHVLRMLARVGDELGLDFESSEQLQELMKELDPEQLMSALEDRLEAVGEERPGD